MTTTYATHKASNAGRTATLARKAARAAKYAPRPASSHIAVQHAETVGVVL